MGFVDGLHFATMQSGFFDTLTARLNAGSAGEARGYTISPGRNRGTYTISRNTITRPIR